jgi:cell division protein FtsZ
MGNVATNMKDWDDFYSLIEGKPLCEQVRPVIEHLSRTPGLINLDFADARTAVGAADSKDDIAIGFGTCSGDERAETAARLAIESMPEDSPIANAASVLMEVVGSSDMGLVEVSAAADVVSAACAKQAILIFGSSIDENMGENVSVAIIAAMQAK